MGIRKRTCFEAMAGQVQAEFAARWDEFQVCWKWSQNLSYAPERRPGLWGCFDLMDAKKRFDTYAAAQKRSHQGGSGLGTVVPNPAKERLPRAQRGS